MSVDLTSFILLSEYDAFKNNNVYTGTFNISGTFNAGTTILTYPVTLTSTPDMVDIVFNGPTDALYDIRPADGWFKKGLIWITGTGTLGVYTNAFEVYGVLNGSTLNITVTYVQQYLDPTTFPSTTCYYRLVDYSVF